MGLRIHAEHSKRAAMRKTWVAGPQIPPHLAPYQIFAEAK